jgi:dTDP-4-dehydrorhamnose 3,5-epimerase
MIKVTKCPIEGLLILEPTVYRDERGYFMESYNKKELQDLGIDAVFVQDNQSMSVKGVLRGLHFQKHFPQAKLVRVVSGEVFDVAVDLRKDSETYGKWFGIVLSDLNKKQLYIPEGFAHGFLTLSKSAKLQYKCTDIYHKEDQFGLVWNDPDVGIEWPGLIGDYDGTAESDNYVLSDGGKLIISSQDIKWPILKNIDLD